MAVSKTIGVSRWTLSTIERDTPAIGKPAVELIIPDGPRIQRPPLFDRTYKSARGAFRGLFKKSTPNLELTSSAKSLQSDQIRRRLVQFARTAGLNLPREVYRSRAAYAERQAIGAETLPEKIAWLTLAFDGYLTAAQFDAPSAIRRSQLDATKVAELITSIVPTEGKRQFWAATSRLLRGDTDGAASALVAAQDHPLSDDMAAAIDELINHVARIDGATQVEGLVSRMITPAVNAGELEAVATDARALAQTQPDRALRLVAIELEAERRIAKMVGGVVSTDDAHRRIDNAFQRMNASLEAQNRFSEREFLPFERALLLAKNFVADGQLEAAEAELAGVIEHGMPDQARQAATLRAEIAIRNDPAAVDERIDDLFKRTPSIEGHALIAGLKAAVASDPITAIERLDVVIGNLSQRGIPATYASGGQSVITARIQTTKDKLLELPAVTLTPDEAFLLADAHANRAMLLVATGNAADALEGLNTLWAHGGSDRPRTARALASMMAGRIGAAKEDLAWLREHSHDASDARVMLDDPIVSQVLAGSRPDPLEVATLAKRVLAGGTSRYLSASSAYPLAAASDVPAARLFERCFTKRDTWGVDTLGPYEAHIAMADSTVLGLARGTEEPASAALRSLDPVTSSDMAGMVNSLLSRQSMQRPAREILRSTLGREALLGATENLEVISRGDGAIETFVSEQIALTEHTCALTLGCTDAGFMAQIEQVLDRHRALGRTDAPRAGSVDQMLGHLNAVTSLGQLTTSKKRLKAKDTSGALRSTWREISEAVKTGDLEALGTIDEARTAIHRLGFKQVPGRPELYDRQGAWVRLVEQNIGEAVGFDLQVGKPTNGGAFQKYQRMVSVDGLMFEGKHWQYFEKGYHRTQQRYANAMRRMVGRETEWRSDMKGVRALIGLGRSFGLSRDNVDGKLGSKKFEMGMELHTLSRQASAQLEKLKAEGRAPKGVMIMVDGIDAASKTSNGERLMDIFKRGGYEGEWKSFKAPTAEEREQHWLARYDAHRPGAGQVFMCDRSPLGDYAYNRSLKQDDLERMADDFRRWQEDMEKQGILVLNFLFYPGVRKGKSKRAEKNPKETVPDLWRPMFTFGKREGRALAAREMLLRAKAAGAPQDVQDGLAEAAELHPGINDLRSFHDGVLVHGRFRKFADAIETEHRWKIIPTERRHKGRKRVLKFAIERLEAMA